jgi:choline dehydrogenase-like flavoprotein
MSTQEHFDVILIGTGAGGGTLLNRLAPSGKRILVLERGPFLKREKANWDYHGSFQYYSSEVWRDQEGNKLYPGTSYYVGGNTKVYGAAHYRLREKDFEAYPTCDGLSPAWPLTYRDFQPYYHQAERLYQVHGKWKEDPTEPWRSGDYPHPPLSHEPRISELAESLRLAGLHPAAAPSGIRLNEAKPQSSPCIRCNTCDGYPCLMHAKSDAEVCGVRPVMDCGQITLLTEAKVERLVTNGTSRRVKGVEVEIGGSRHAFTGDIVVVSCGAVNSAALLLRSANDKHPEGLANSSGQVGRNLMKHVLGSLLSVLPGKPNPTAFQKTITINDYYWGEPGYAFPMGNIQLMGRTHRLSLKGQEERFHPVPLDTAAKCALDWWLTSEDIPDPRNRVRVGRDGIEIHYHENNLEPFERLAARWNEVMQKTNCGTMAEAFKGKPSVHVLTRMGRQNLAHQVGTCRFGTDPQTSVLDLDCKAHDLDNLYVVDGSFFPSSGALNPSLTIIANALRVGDRLLERMK